MMTQDLKRLTRRTFEITFALEDRRTATEIMRCHLELVPDDIAVARQVLKDMASRGAVGKHTAIVWDLWLDSLEFPTTTPYHPWS